MLEGVMVTPRGRVAQLQEPTAEKADGRLGSPSRATIEKEMQWRARGDSSSRLTGLAVPP